MDDNGPQGREDEVPNGLAKTGERCPASIPQFSNENAES